MPRASWRGFLRLSLVSCPIYLCLPRRWRVASMARLLIIPQSGHLSPLEQPTDVTQALIDLLRIPVDGNDI